jgi:hypothetical protein
MDLTTATEIYVLKRSHSPLVLVPDSANTPTVVREQPLLLRAVYVPVHDLESGIQSARAQLVNDYAFLLAPIICPDGPPYRSGVLFVDPKPVNGVSWRDGSMIYHGANTIHYKSATNQVSWQWISDAQMGRYGYFLTGESGTDSLWRLFRLESDVFRRSILTLAPVRLASGCPQADFSGLPDPLLAEEVAEQYADVCRSVVNHGYRNAVTQSRSIVEGIVWARLGATGGRDLFADLQTIKKLIETQKDNCSWKELEYHLAHKIRLVHAQTHASKVAKSGRALTPEFALSAVEDLIELLRIWGYCSA